MPLILLLIPFALLVAYFAAQPGAPADDAAAPGQDPGAGAAAPDGGGLFAPVEIMLRKVFQLPARGAPFADAIAAAETRYGIPESLLGRVLYEESRFRPDIISGATVSSAGALGIAQFMPATAAQLGVDPLDPVSAIDGAGRYLRQLFDQFGDWAAVLAAYNWGEGNVQRKGIERAPRATKKYVADILGDVGA